MKAKGGSMKEWKTQEGLCEKLKMDRQGWHRWESKMNGEEAI